VTQARASANGPVGWVDESAPTRRDFFQPGSGWWSPSVVAKMLLVGRFVG
jgi:hypothetical protein